MALPPPLRLGLRSRLAPAALLCALASGPLQAELVWYSPLDGNANAVVGSNPTPVGAPSPAADRNGNPNSAVEFDGSGDYYDIGHHGAFTAGTLAAWVRADTNASERGAFCAGASGGGAAQYFSFMNDNAGLLRVDLDDGNVRLDVRSSSPLAIGQWTHVATTWAANGTLRLFLDGIQQPDQQGGLASSYTMTFNGLLGTERTDSRYWDGAIDDAGLWNEELSARTVAALHGLAKFQGLGLDHPAIDTVSAFSSLGQSVAVDSLTWDYVDGLAGGTGTTGGSVAGEDAFVVLDGATGRGIRVRTGPATPPTVVNSAASDVNATSATVGGMVTNTGGEDPEVTIYWGDNDGGTNPAAWDQAVPLGVRDGSFASNLAGLSPATTYFFRCFAANSGGPAWASSSLSFTTPAPPNPPTVVNSPASNVGFTTAEIGGQVTDTGGEAPQVTLFWGDNDGGTVPGAWDHTTDLATQSGAFADSLFDLADGTTYYFRSFASNSGGAAWAPASESFTTLAFSLASLAISPATGVTGVSAQLHGAVTSTGGESPVVNVLFGASDGGTDPAAWDSAVNLGVQSGPFSTVLDSLTPNTTYFFTASGQNTAGLAWAPSASFTTPEISDLAINEFMASNDGGTPVPNQMPGTAHDWIEIHNRGASTLSLAGWHLTDDPATLDKWTFPPGVDLAPGGFLVVFASGDNAPDPNGNLHTNFALNAGGEYVALVRPSLTVASEFGPSGTAYPAQEADVSYGLHPNTLDSVFFQSPTPGAPNDPGGQLRVADLQLSHQRGFYTAPIAVALSSPTAGASIRYTLDGTEPTASSNGLAYTGPIPIATTTVLRARAFQAGAQPSTLETRSYIFPLAVRSQTQPPGYPSSWGGEPNADYDVDTQISFSGQYASRFLHGFRDLPTVSVAGDQNDFFGPAGVYVDTQNRNLEAPVSAEYFRPDPGADGAHLEAGFQIDCGLKLQGGASRNPGSSIKHSLSLRFRGLYGPGRLNYPLFEQSGVERFDSIHLRAMYNNSWIHSNSSQRARATMIRDQWARDCLIDMGNPDGGHGHFVHLFINGLYWGVFNLHERLENDHYAEYHGYDSDTVLGYNPGRPTTEESSSFNAMRQVVTDDASSWAQIKAVLDVDNYIDFLIVQHFAKNNDLKTNGNWRAAGGGSAAAPWRFYAWDTERTLESLGDTGTPGAGGDGAGIFDDLDDHREFRVRFADRAYRHLFHGGALTNLDNRARFQKYATQIDTAVVCESARWGDDRSGGGFLGNYARDENWTRAVYGTPGGPGTDPSNGVLGTWFPLSGTSRTTVIVDNWKSRTFPGSSDTFLGTVDPPQFTVNGSPQHGGEIPAGGSLSATAPSGAIYYTTDGSDPRLEGGNIAPNAVLLSGALPLSASGLVRMRAKAGPADSWSPLSEASFYLESRATPADLRITELHYNAVPPNAVETEAGANLPLPRTFSGGDFEFAEISNVSAAAVNLDGVRFTDGIGFAFSNWALAAGERVLVVSDLEAFQVRYGSGLPVAGQFTGALDNGGERIAYAAWDDALIQDFSYDDSGPWPGRADGNGSSLEAVDLGGNYDDPRNWRSSSEYHGSPGIPGAGPDARVVVNEVLTNTSLPAVDRIELHNTTAAPISVANWYLSDSNSNYKQFRIPSGVLPAGGYLAWDESDFNANQNLPILSYSGTPAAAPTTVTTAPHGKVTGDLVTISGYGGIGRYNDTFEVTVVSPTAFTIPVPFLDDQSTKGTYTRGRPFALSAQGEDVWLLEGDASGKLLKFVDRVEFAAAFPGDTLGRWPDGAGTGTLVTMTANTIGAPNSGPRVGPVIVSEVMYHPDATIEDNLEFVEICNAGTATENLAHWRMRGGVDFDFTAAHELPPGGLLVLVGFDPALEAAAASAFRAAYNLDDSIPLVGPWSDGPLNNDTGTVRLQRPDLPPPDDPDNYPQVTEDEVIYANTFPWPEEADGNGASLHRAGPALFGNFATSWHAAASTPGGKPLAYADYRALVFGPGAPPGSAELDDFDLDGLANVLEFALGLDPLVSDAYLMPAATLEAGQLTLTYSRNTLLIGLDHEVQASTDLLTWTPVPDTLVSSLNFIETRQASVAAAPNQRLFLRIAITY